MTFTDEDLKQLKEHINDEDCPRITLASDKLSALIARLEAAEACIIPEELLGITGFMEEKYEAWRKAAGK